jgi:GNAT superfamily N-acetyltransferase
LTVYLWDASLKKRLVAALFARYRYKGRFIVRNVGNTHMLRIIQASLKRLDHQKALRSLIDEYRQDPMGGMLPPMSDELARMLVLQLCNHPMCLILLAMLGSEFAGMIIAFVNISSFKAKPLLNVHDLIVKKDFRKQGIGKQLLLKAAEHARLLGCCRLTLEVRTDNKDAQRLYRSIGFAPCQAPMEFWHCNLTEDKQGPK